MTLPILFSGPSLSPSDRRHPGIDFRPPAAQGDVLRAIESNPTAIAIVDGYFGDRLAVHQKEILEALDYGIPVLGAASMGALRAVELAQYGMIGIGGIYEDYASGKLVSDADVAVSHGPSELGFIATSISMVDFQATMQRLRQQARLTAEMIATMTDIGENLHFGDRSWVRIASDLQKEFDAPANLQSLLKAAHVKRKLADARLLLRFLIASEFPPVRVPVSVPRTQAYGVIRRRALNRA